MVLGHTKHTPTRTRTPTMVRTHARASQVHARKAQDKMQPVYKGQPVSLSVGAEMSAGASLFSRGDSAWGSGWEDEEDVEAIEAVAVRFLPG